MTARNRVHDAVLVEHSSERVEIVPISIHYILRRIWGLRCGDGYRIHSGCSCIRSRVTWLLSDPQVESAPLSYYQLSKIPSSPALRLFSHIVEIEEPEWVESRLLYGLGQRGRRSS